MHSKVMPSIHVLLVKVIDGPVRVAKGKVSDVYLAIWSYSRIGQLCFAQQPALASDSPQLGLCVPSFIHLMRGVKSYYGLNEGGACAAKVLDESF